MFTSLIVAVFEEIYDCGIRLVNFLAICYMYSIYGRKA